MVNPEKANKDLESEAEINDVEKPQEDFLEARPEVGPEDRGEIDKEIRRLKEEIEKPDESVAPQEMDISDPRIIEKMKGPEDAPKEFGLRERALNRVSELGFVDRGLQRRAEWFIENSHIEDYLVPGGQYLDVGTGKGHIVQRILGDQEESGNPLVAYYGIDVADRPLRKVQAREAKRRGVSLRENPNPMNFSFGSADALPFEDGSLDGVSYIFSIHHMSKEMLEKVMAEGKRVIKRDGKIFIAEDLAGTDEQKKVTERADKRINFEVGGEHNYKGDQEWEKYFNEIGLTVSAKEFFKSGVVQHGFYVLELKPEE